MAKFLLTLVLFSSMTFAWERQVNVPHRDFLGQSISRCQVFLKKLSLFKSPLLKNTQWESKVNPNKLVLRSMQPRDQQIRETPPVGSTSFEVGFEHIQFIAENQTSTEPIFTKTPQAIVLNKSYTKTIPQEVSQTRESDREIIDLSFANNHVREVARVTLNTRNGNSFKTQLLIGQHDNVDISIKVYETLLNEARLAIDIPEEIEMVHSHPTIEFITDFHNTTSIILSPLSATDIGYLISLSRKYPDILITEKVVTPQGLTYTAKFKNGKQVWPVEEK